MAPRAASVVRRGLRVVGVAFLVTAAGGCAAVQALRGDADRATPPPIGPPAAEFSLPAVEERVLPNGLTVLAIEDRTLPLVGFHLLLPAGAVHDSGDRIGVAALTADLLRRGTRRADAQELAREIEFLGGRLDGNAGRDFATVSGEFLSKDLARGLELFTEVVREPAFREDEFRRARGLTLAGIVSGRERLSSVADRCYAAYLYGDHPYGRPVSGTEATVGRLGSADVRRFYERHYGPAGAVLVLFGDAPAAAMLDRAAAAFGSWSSAGGGEGELEAPARVRGRRILLVDKPGANQAHIRIGTNAIARTDPAYVAAGVTSVILGGGFGSRLFDELRVKRSLTYGAWSAFATARVPGDLRIGTFTKTETTGEALTVARAVLDGFATEGGTAAELERAKSLLTGQYPRRLETSGAVAGQLAELEAYGLPRSDLETYPARVVATTQTDVAKLAGRYVPTDDLVIVVVGDAAAIAPQLAELGPIDRTTPAACDDPDAPRAVP